MGHFTDSTPHLEQKFSLNGHLNTVTALTVDGSPFSHAGVLWEKPFVVSLGEIFLPASLFCRVSNN